jgi:hypothetical protein
MRVRLFQFNESMKTETKSPTEYPLTSNQYKALAPEQQQAINTVAEYLSGDKFTAQPTDQEISSTLTLLKPGAEEYCDDPLNVQMKCGAIYEVALELAQAELKRRNVSNCDLRLVLAARCNEVTQVAVVARHKPICYLYEAVNACDLCYDQLDHLANAIIGVKNRLVERFDQSLEIYVIMDGGVIHEIVGLPDNIHVTVLDYDIEGVEKERLEISPLDGEVCTINSW